jgi:hypothetical protein
MNRNLVTRSTVMVALAVSAGFAGAQGSGGSLDARLDALEAQVVAAEDVSALKRLQREYGYYVDKGMWEDVADLYSADAVANYPAGTYIGHESIRKHLYMNVGGGQVGENGLPDNRIYDHLGRGRVRDDVRERERRLEDQDARLSLGLRRSVLDGLGAARAAPARDAGRCRRRRSARGCGGIDRRCRASRPAARPAQFAVSPR